MTNWNWKFYGIQFRIFFPRVLTMFCQAVRITFSSCSCLDLAVSPCVSCRSHVWKVFLPNHLKSQKNEMPDTKIKYFRHVTESGHTLTHLWGSCCHGMKRSGLLVAGHYSSYITTQSNPTRLKPRKCLRDWPTLTTNRPLTSPVCLQHSAALGCILQRRPWFCCVSDRTIWRGAAGLSALAPRHRCHPADSDTFAVGQ